MFERFKAWLNEPYRVDMSALQWFYFFGLLIVIAALWSLILRQIRNVAT